MSNRFSSPARKLINHFDPVITNALDSYSKQLATRETIKSGNNEISITISRECKIFSIEINDCIFQKDKKESENIIIQTINSSFKVISEKTNIFLRNLQFEKYFRTAPKELLPEMTDRLKEYGRQITAFENEERTFSSGNKKMVITVSGGMNFISIDIMKDLFTLSNKRELELELMNTINDIYEKIMEKRIMIGDECKGTLFNNSINSKKDI